LVVMNDGGMTAAGTVYVVVMFVNLMIGHEVPPGWCWRARRPECALRWRAPAR
jgi:hypothetical protein